MNLLARIENWVVDDMTPKQVRYLKPVLPREASGKVAEIYQQVRQDFQLVPPITLFSVSPDLLGGIWSLWREAQFARGHVSRPVKEAIAASVSQINACPYCVDAHTGMLHASSEHGAVKGILGNDGDAITDESMRAIIEWASATRTPDSAIIQQPPFTSEQAPEIIGTALTYQFVNRMVSLFLVDTPMPVPAGISKMRRMAARIFGATVGKRILARQPVAGESLRFVPETILPEGLAWAASNDSIAAALGGCVMLIEAAGKRILPESVRTLVQQELVNWNGEHKGLGRQWLEANLSGLPDRDKPIAKFALLAAFSPFQVDENLIQEFRMVRPEDRDLLGAALWSSMAAARRTCSWLTVPVARSGYIPDDPERNRPIPVTTISM